jgi:hypothetical protein
VAGGRREMGPSRSAALPRCAPARSLGCTRLAGALPHAFRGCALGSARCGQLLSPVAHVTPWRARDARASPLRRPLICARQWRVERLRPAAARPARLDHRAPCVKAETVCRVDTHRAESSGADETGPPTCLGGDHATCAHERAVVQAKESLQWGPRARAHVYGLLGLDSGLRSAILVIEHSFDPGVPRPMPRRPSLPPCAG